MCPCYWLFCTAVEERKGQNGRQAVDQRPHEFVFVVWQRGRIYKSSDSSHPVSGPSWAEVLPSEGMSLGVLFLVGIHKCEPEGDEVISTDAASNNAGRISGQTRPKALALRQPAGAPGRRRRSKERMSKKTFLFLKNQHLSQRRFGTFFKVMLCWVLNLYQLS